MSVDVKAKLNELGLQLPVASIPLAAYVPAVRTGNLVFTAGQLPLVDGAIPFVGKVDGGVTPDQAKEMAQVCALNAIAALGLVADINNVERVVQVRGFVNGVSGFVGHPGVVNGVSELFIKIWGEEKGKHARTAIGVAELPLNSPVEVEVIFELKA
ncbi:MAG: RidA family protein [Actinomycetes bacterium]|jgi:enamine deaminase RidA (YjgF/YER057c/UK114 family)